ncbi:MAG: hypothetical protein ACI4MQ_01845 [Candidatus Coproplasma sp.]
MIIYTGRFQPFHNGHLQLIKTLRSRYSAQRICLAIIKDVPLSTKSEFDQTVDLMLEKRRNPFNAEETLSLINQALHVEGIDDVIVTLMPRASIETWPTITALFDCERIWAFTENQSERDEWEDKKCAFYEAQGDKVVRIPIKKDISGSKIRELIGAKNYVALEGLLPECILNYLKNDGVY